MHVRMQDLEELARHFERGHVEPEAAVTATPKTARNQAGNVSVSYKASQMVYH